MAGNKEEGRVLRKELLALGLDGIEAYTQAVSLLARPASEKVRIARLSIPLRRTRLILLYGFVCVRACTWPVLEA